mmetsp:Transcript_10723/g.21175  ORF Transcript_10723/g.21175 Transcript_10723/m.21175 type:complete len:227 (+) Transcript_10723:1-681(+)
MDFASSVAPSSPPPPRKSKPPPVWSSEGFCCSSACSSPAAAPSAWSRNPNALAPASTSFPSSGTLILTTFSVSLEPPLSSSRKPKLLTPAELSATWFCFCSCPSACGPSSSSSRNPNAPPPLASPGSMRECRVVAFAVTSSLGAGVAASSSFASRNPNALGCSLSSGMVCGADCLASLSPNGFPYSKSDTSETALLAGARLALPSCEARPRTSSLARDPKGAEAER